MGDAKKNEPVDLYAEDLTDVEAEDLPGETALASLSSLTTAGSASCPASSASSLTTAGTFG
ncbi:thiocillin family RiPP [Streptosporangium sandarakinum]|uniref:thiocillin family RiPP n=1 Tax=Streptosporangium TaxID=2000 RepID=UPI0031F9065E